MNEWHDDAERSLLQTFLDAVAVEAYDAQIQSPSEYEPPTKTDVEPESGIIVPGRGVRRRGNERKDAAVAGS
jgi:hypothetical protein